MIKKNFLLAGALAWGMAMSAAGWSERMVSSAPLGPIWQVEQTSLGGLFGVALSPDGKAVVYLGMQESDPAGNSMFLADLETGKHTLLQGPDDPYVPSQPSFSPDGKSIVFVLGGLTSSYPSDIYTIGRDGNLLTKLTESLMRAYPPESVAYSTGANYQRYYGRPRYSPDGSRILLFVEDEVAAKGLTAVMGADGSNLEVLAEGRPVGWSADSKAVYYTHKGLLTRMEMETRATRTVPLPRWKAGLLSAA